MINSSSPINIVDRTVQYYSNFDTEPNDEHTSSFIKIFLYQPQNRIQSIRIKSDKNISSLSCHYVKDMVFIYNGLILDENKTFSFYNISNESTIAMIPRDILRSNSLFQDKLIKITSDKEVFDKRIEICINSNNRKELSRLLDIKYQKMELRKRNHNFFVRSFLLSQNFDGNSQKLNNSNNYYDLYKKGTKTDQIKLNIDYDIEENPSAQPLPIIW